MAKLKAAQRKAHAVNGKSMTKKQMERFKKEDKKQDEKLMKKVMKKRGK